MASHIGVARGDLERVAAHYALHHRHGDILAEVEHPQHLGHNAHGVEVHLGGIVVLGLLGEDGDVLARAVDGLQ